ncbi:putative receptor protein kinase ZmPK1 [Platanthera guangdongensis]|uniref:Receptor-like serine/threonine-protein kinase n=1 Tax=Platanthera guangdongensis TaxID=2320717 RepID=A0ABR2LZR9_9ASPA
MFLPLLLLLLWLSWASAYSPQSHLFRNSYLSVEDGASLLISQDKSFSSGFYRVGLNAYTFSTWFTNSADKTVVWTANRDKPVNGHGSRLTLLNNGAMTLTDVDGTVAWSTAATSSVPDRALLRDNGNLVVEDSYELRQPDRHPPPAQPITRNAMLVSAIARGSFSSGYYGFYFDDSNVLRLKYDGPEISSVYWPNPDQTVWQNGRTIYNSSRYAVLDEKGSFLASDRFQFGAADEGKPWIKRKLTLDYDGNLRLYSLENRTGLWSVTWQALLDTCQVHGLCGKNGICSSHEGLACYCPPGFEMTDPRNWNLGCRPNFSLSCPLKQEEIEFIYLQHTDFWGFDIKVATEVSLDDCKRICMADCRCQGFSYMPGSGICYPKSVLYNGRATPYTDIYIKSSRRPTATLKLLQHQSLICNATPQVAPTVGSSEMMMKSSWNTIWICLYSLLAVIFVVEGLFISVGWWFIYSKEDDDHVLMAEGYKAISNQFRRFSYRELEKATRNFGEEVGRGGSGVVYKGVLENGMVAAVKKLEDVRQGDEEFWGEVSVIGRIYHMNLVRTWGFCSEDLHRLLVCEFVENGSLEKALFDSNYKLLGWKERFQIAVGVARGLAYLHHECLEWVIHCDVKPENILLDRNYEPKIADFGLAKLLNRGGAGSSNLSRIRGTRGYIAPEWASNLPITGKIDVYSYGVVLLELVSGSRVSDLVMKGVTEMMAMKKMCATLGRKLERGGENWVGSFVDLRLKGQFDSNQAVRMVKVAVSCLGEEGIRRPTMETVVQMLLSGDDQEFYTDATDSLQFSSFSTDT